MKRTRLEKIKKPTNAASPLTRVPEHRLVRQPTNNDKLSATFSRRYRCVFNGSASPKQFEGTTPFLLSQPSSVQVLRLRCSQSARTTSLRMTRFRTEEQQQMQKQILRLRRRMTTKKQRQRKKQMRRSFPFDELRVRMTNLRAWGVSFIQRLASSSSVCRWGFFSARRGRRSGRPCRNGLRGFACACRPRTCGRRGGASSGSSCCGGRSIAR
jgi:hypothetical protein